MLRFSANISMLFREVPMMDRIELAAKSGFDALEIQFPYELDAHEFKRGLDDCKLPLALMNFPVGDLMSQGMGLAAIPGREKNFDDALKIAREYAEILQPRAMNLLAGSPNPKMNLDDCFQVFESSLRKAYQLTSSLDIQLLTEPVNHNDWPGFLLSNSSQVIKLMAGLDDVDLKIQYDIFHMHQMESDLLYRVPQIIDKIGHFQFADLPGRGEPGSGDIDFAAFFTMVNQLPFNGYLGAEYLPTGDSLLSLGWLDRVKSDIR